MLLKNTESPFGKILLHVCGLDASVRQGVPPAVAKGRVRDPHLAEQTPAGLPSRGESSTDRKPWNTFTPRMGPDPEG